MPSPKSLTSFSLLSFDCYGTLIDWETGLHTSLQPLLSRLPPDHPLSSSQPLTPSRLHALRAFASHEHRIRIAHPTDPYNTILAAAYASFGAELGLAPVSDDDASAFGTSIGSFPAFPDTVAALKKLATRYKLVILSNIDNANIAATLAGPLAGVPFSAVYTAQDIGDYKPSKKNFEYLFERCERELGVAKEQVLHTAHSLEIDHVTAKELGVASAWIVRGEADGRVESALGSSIEELEDQVDLSWRFRGMEEMAEAVEEAFGRE